jgi:hypothetical protein
LDVLGKRVHEEEKVIVSKWVEVSNLYHILLGSNPIFSNVLVA